MSDDSSASIEDSMYEGFRMMSHKEQVRRIVIGSNAEFVLRMTAGQYLGDSVVDRAVRAVTDALRRGLPEAD